jgi:hypothetical protein
LCVRHFTLACKTVLNLWTRSGFRFLSCSVARVKINLKVYSHEMEKTRVEYCTARLHCCNGCRASHCWKDGNCIAGSVTPGGSFNVRRRIAHILFSDKSNVLFVVMSMAEYCAFRGFLCVVGVPLHLCFNLM